MTSTPKPNRAPTRHAEDLTDEEFGQLMTLEEAVWYLRNNKAPVIEIGKAAHALKTSGLWKRPYYNDDPNWPEARTSYTWEDYCRLHMPYTRRYLDVLIRYWKRGNVDETTPELPVDRTRRHQNGAQGVEQDTISLTPVISVKLDEHLRAVFDRMVSDANVSISDMLRAMIVKCAILDGYLENVPN